MIKKKLQVSANTKKYLFIEWVEGHEDGESADEFGDHAELDQIALVRLPQKSVSFPHRLGIWIVCRNTYFPRWGT